MSGESKSSTFVTRHRSTVVVNETPEELANLDFPVRIPNQNFALVSYAGPTTVPKSGGFALRIYGTFATFDEADRAASKAQELGFTLFDLDIVDISHGFFPLPPPRDADIPHLEYSSDRLNQIMAGHKDRLETGSRRMEERAEATLDTRTSDEVFHDMTMRAATQLFEDWRKKGRKPTGEKVLKAKTKKMKDAYIQEILDQQHGGASAEMTETEYNEASAEARERGMQLAHPDQVIKLTGEDLKPALSIETTSEGKQAGIISEEAADAKAQQHGGRLSPSAHTTRPLRLQAVPRPTSNPK